MNKRAQFIGIPLASVLSLLAVFFGVFNVLFSDIFSTREKIGAVALVTGEYFLFSLVLSLLWPQQSRRWLLIFSVPIVVVVILMTFGEPGRLFYHFSVLIGGVAGSVLGSWIGHFRHRRTVLSKQRSSS